MLKTALPVPSPLSSQSLTASTSTKTTPPIGGTNMCVYMYNVYIMYIIIYLHVQLYYIPMYS